MFFLNDNNNNNNNININNDNNDISNNNDNNDYVLRVLNKNPLSWTSIVNK